MSVVVRVLRVPPVLLLAALLPVYAGEAAVLPVTGAENADLVSFDKLMRSFMTEHNVPGAALAVTKDSRLVYARGFGFADAQKKEPVQPTSLFRIASLSKSITGVAVLQLVEQGKFGLDDKMLERLSPDMRPANIGDARLEQVTVRQLLHHTGGWDSAKSYDPMFRSVEIAKAEKADPPAAPEDIIRYMLRRKLDFDPGTRHAYSNFGYCILGRIIERASGETYETYVREKVLAPLGITAMRIGKTLPEGRAAGEVEYLDSKGRTGAAVVGAPLGRKVPLPYGTFCLEALDAHGGWIASAVDLVRFAAAFDDPARCKILKPESIKPMFERPEGPAGYETNGKPKAAYYACGWSVRPVGNTGKANTWHNGLLSGSSTIMVRRHDGINWAVLFNSDSDAKGKNLAGEIDGLVHQAADAVRKWPEGE
ncbi:MAG: serine hydrolase [Planctomycetota bacterium]|nr:serine hydrolase [Planctomycetota bacterium]